MERNYIVNINKWSKGFRDFSISIFVIFGVVVFSILAKAQDSNQLLVKSIESKYDAVDLLKRAERMIQTDKQLALEIGNSILDNAMLTGNKELEVRSEVLLGKIYKSQNSYDSALLYFNYALELSREIENDNFEATALIGLGEVYSSKMQYDSAYNNYYQALLKALKTENDIQLGEIYNSLGGFYYDCGNIGDAEIYWQKAINISSKINDLKGIARMENNIGEVYRLNGEYHKALDCFSRALVINRDMENKHWLATNYDNMGMIYHKLGKQEKALEFINNGIYLSREIGYAKGESAGYSSLGLFYQNNNQPDSALKYFRLAFSLSQKIHEINTLKKASEGLSKVYELSVQPDSALYYQKKFKNFSDTILNTRNLTRVSLLLAQAQFENENRMREIKVKKTRNRYFIVILALALVLVIISFIYFIQRNKVQLLDLKKQNLELEKKYLNNELTNFAIHINQKNEFLSDLKGRIQNLRIQSSKDDDNSISEIKSLIMQNIQQKDDIDDFYNYADKLNRELVIKLNQKFPGLTANEIQLCVLLKLNLSTKEVASIRHVTPRAIKVARYRLRKKLNLPAEGNISDYLNSI